MTANDVAISNGSGGRLSELSSRSIPEFCDVADMAELHEKNAADPGWFWDALPLDVSLRTL